MRTTGLVRIERADIAWLDKLGLALSRHQGGKWPRTKVLRWLRETHGVAEQDMMAWLCGRCLRRIFEPGKTRLEPHRPGKRCKWCGAFYTVRQKMPGDYYIDGEDWYKAAGRRAIRQQLTPKAQKAFDKGQDFFLCFTWPVDGRRSTSK